MYGSSPYCLKCSTIGHVRQCCHGKLFSADVNNDMSASKNADSSPAAANESSLEVSSGPSDVREVKKKVDEYQKQINPHFVKFKSGQSVLNNDLYIYYKVGRHIASSALQLVM